MTPRACFDRMTSLLQEPDHVNIGPTREEAGSRRLDLRIVGIGQDTLPSRIPTNLW